ncbi:hypothetical protein ATCC90586_003242 [Pythium insidiosum]|nr:hypothetical protein ATCC90586_003242 [Pythium insidiosum]
MPEVMEMLSDVSSDAEREHEIEDEDEVMDPSDPRAHGRATLQRGARAVQNGAAKSRWDSDSDAQAAPNGGATGSDMAISSDSEGDEDVDEDLGERVDIQVDGDDEDGSNAAPTPAPEAMKTKLSSWAASRFLVPRKDRKIPVLEEPPLEPLNDFILSDFGTRFRGAAGEVETQKAIVDDDNSDEDDEQARLDAKFQVGAPLFSTAESNSNAKDDAKPSDEKATTRKRRENRYFVTDLATKCFNCGQVGHVSNMCANDKVHKPCYYCGMRGHNTYACPHLPCSSCLQLGHEARCRTEHSPRDVSCMVCLSPGHLHCAPIPPPADRRVYCPHCAGNHTLRHCRDFVEPIVSSFTARPPRADMKCFLCNKPGHIAAECPQRSGYNGGNSCFNCGERGHYASDCPANRAGAGRKRSRHDRFVDMNHDDDDDDDYSYRQTAPRRGRGGRYTDLQEASDDDSHYYEVPGNHRNTKRARSNGYNHNSSRSVQQYQSYSHGNSSNRRRR